MDAQRGIHCRCNQFHKRGRYGIPNFSCCRIDDGALRADHSGLFKTARMVTANRNEEVIKMNTLSTPLTQRREACA